MSDELFNLAPTPPDELEAARARLARAQASYDRNLEAQDEFGDPIWGEVEHELKIAHRELSQIERYRLNRRIK